MTHLKHLARCWYLVQLRPSTHPAPVAEAVWTAFRNPTATMLLLRMWSELAEPSVVNLIMRYEARGANRNDITRRVGAAAGLAPSQLKVVELATLNLDEVGLLCI